MAKKNFSSGFDKLLGSTPSDATKGDEQKKKEKEVETVEEQKEAVDPEVRATYILKQSTVNRLKDIAYWERAMLKEIIQDALEGYVENWEKENKELLAKSKRKFKGK